MSDIDLDKEKVSCAVSALKKLAEKLNQKSLVDSAEQVQLQICLKKIPPKEKKIKLKLPHGIRHENMDVCLFVKDLDKDERDYEPTVRYIQDLLRKHNISSVSEIIPLKSLKTEYKPFEAKRNLSNAYDVFLADARITRLLPTYLGKHFYGKNKTPIQVNILSKKLKEDIDAVLDNSSCVISGRGASSMAVVATLHLGDDDVTENLISSVTQICAALPGGAANIKQLSIKTPLSTSIPIYMDSGAPQAITIPKDADKKEVVEAEEISTLFGAKVKVFPSGEIKVIKDGQKESKKRKRSGNAKSALKKSPTESTKAKPVLKKAKAASNKEKPAPKKEKPAPKKAKTALKTTKKSVKAPKKKKLS